jgi:tetratricopeptide (TPR) repeat protein
MEQKKGKDKKRKILILALIFLFVLGVGGTFTVRAVRGNKAQTFLDLGNKYLLDGDYEQAVLQFEDVLKIDKKNVDARINLAKAYVALKKPDKAVVVLKDGIKLTAKEYKLYLALADTYISEGNTEEAIKALDEGYSKTKNEELKKKLDEIKSTIELAIEKSPLQIGHSTPVSLVQKDKDGNVIKELSAEWKIKDTKIGSISKDGAYKANYKAIAGGKDEITAAIGKVSFVKEIEVKDRVLDRLEITSETTEGRVGDSVKFKVTGYDQLGQQMEVTPTWELGGDIAKLANTEGQYATLDYVKDGQLSLTTSVGNIKESVDVKIQKRKYTVVTMIAGKGTVEKEPNTEEYLEDTDLKLTATPERGWHFVKWAGSVPSTANPLVIKISDNKEIKAEFAIDKHTLKTEVVGQGDIGRSVYKSSYDYGTTVKLTAAPRAGYKFDHWEGNASGKNPVITVQMNSNKKVKAVFVIDDYVLKVEKSGEGEVTRSEDKTRYPQNSIVKLTAKAAEGYKFDHWEGDANGVELSVSVTMDSNKSVKAVFVPIDYKLSVEVQGNGTVSQEKVETHKIKLTAKAEQGFMFSHWEGDLTGKANPVTIEVKSDKKVKAVFVKKEYVVNVTTQGKGNVEKIKQADGKLQLKAIPTDGWSFDYWEGDLTGSVNPISIEVKSDLNIKAIFKAPSTDKTVTVYPGEQVVAGYIDVPANANTLSIESFFGTISGAMWPDMNVKSPNGEWFGYNSQYMSGSSYQEDTSNKSSTKATYSGYGASDEKMTFQNPISGKWYIEIRNDGGELPSTFEVKSNYIIYSE